MKGTAEDDVAVLVEALPKAQTIETVRCVEFLFVEKCGS